MELVSMKKNCMGTMDFTLKIGKMKKAEEFTTYPIQDGDDGRFLLLQSPHRWAQLEVKTGRIGMSARRAQYADRMWYIKCILNGTAEKDQATDEQLAVMLDEVRGTASPKAGNNAMHVFCDNRNAALV